ncbi:winged helix-turn-helix transcriptional regulator [Limisphaera sp. VF-2]|jgi:DNA-binding HxlR family transcriptional regulator|uniref:winged helix-turn-helix transcriptional regulator n=1 Tax=Limisphaera sp. VF-2 TaxID=3400418 RepID=UPI00176207A2|nr:helix-turn-helix transcriptional regulator [Limisphaera sp.]
MPEVTGPNRVRRDQCPVRHVLDRVGDKWSLLVLLTLRGRRLRFMELKRSIGDISQRVLTQTLRNLERDGYVERQIHPSVPPRVEYFLTPLGRSLLGPVTRLVAWADQHFEAVSAARRRFDAKSCPPAASRSDAPPSS